MDRGATDAVFLQLVRHPCLPPLHTDPRETRLQIANVALRNLNGIRVLSQQSFLTDINS
jgi:hypothetical protein